MRWGRRWGNYWGDDSVTSVRITDLEETPPAAIADWDDQSVAAYLVAVDGKQAAVTSGLELTFQAIRAGRHFVEVFLAGPGNFDEDISEFVSSIPGARVRLTWTASVSSDVAYYAVYWDQGLGGGLTLLSRTKALEVEWISEELTDGTYKFRVDTVDRAGNRVTSASTVTVVIDRYPNAPTDFALDSYDDALDEATFTFTESDSPAVVGYHLYLNDGLGGAIDYGTIAGTVLAGNSSITVGGIGAGEWKAGLRAYDASYEEDNVDQFVEFEVDAVTALLLEDKPNTPLALAVIPAASGTFTLKCSYNAFEELSTGATVKFYRNDGAGGNVDYASVIATGTIPDHTQGDLVTFEIEATSPALTDGLTYVFGAKSATAGGRVSDAADEMSGVADATNPADVTNLAGEAVNYEE